MISAKLQGRFDAVVESHRADLVGLARSIHAHPELAFQEHRASKWIAELCERHGFHVDQPFGGLDTSLRVRVGDSGPHVAVLAEYDALPEIGHACGHNLIAAGAVGAFLALASAARELGGSVSLLGTPAEEGGGGKIRLVEAGAFRDVDAAMMFHPFDRDLVAHPTLATSWLEMTFRGRPAHAAIAPHDGASALTACMDTFRLVDGQRVHFRDGVRVHGFIKHGGEAVNIIPEKAVCQFSVRSFDLREMDRVRAVVERCARAAAMASDVEVTIDSHQGYRNVRSNLAMAERFAAHLAELGRPAVLTDPSVGTGSTDMGDVSYEVPSIHPWIAICDPGEALCHQRRFAECAVSERGFDSMIVAAKAMARTGAELMVDGALLEDARRQFADGSR